MCSSIQRLLKSLKTLATGEICGKHINCSKIKQHLDPVRGRELRRQSSPKSPLVLFVCPRFRTRLSRSLELTMRVFNFVDGQFFFSYFAVTIFCDCSSLSFLTGTLIDFRYCKQLRTRFFRLWESRYRRMENVVDYRVLSIHYYYVYLSLWSIVPVKGLM